MNIALIGAGQRGMIYAKYARERAVVAAVVEPNDGRRNAAGDKFGIFPERRYRSADDFFREGKLCDAVLIASMDRDHYKQTMTALDLGYDVLLEKPISPDPEECLRIQRKANENSRQVIVCHVLRYTNFFAEIKRIVDGKELGKIVTIQHNENIGNYHLAHSFVRGNWRRSDLSSPLIMQKSCHDMDILAWLADSDAKRISPSSRQKTRPPAAPTAASTARWPTNAASTRARRTCRCEGNGRRRSSRTTNPRRGCGRRSLETSPYGRCVYRCDNDVCDHQVTLIEFKNGITVTFHLSGFTNKMYRTIKIMCEHGEIRGDDSFGVIEVTRFTPNATDRYEQTVVRPASVDGGHNGGDAGLMADFLDVMERGGAGSRSSIDRSVESHLMANAAERARVTGRIVDIDELKEELQARIRSAPEPREGKAVTS